MCNDHSLNLRVSFRSRVQLLALMLLALVGVSPSFAQTVVTPDTSGISQQAPNAAALKNWRDDRVNAPPPQEGCFTSSYPDTQWQQVPCATNAHPLPNPPARGPRPSVVGGLPSTVGDGNDAVLSAAGGHITLGVGSFDSVTGVTSLTSEFGSNDYALQLNTNTFSTPACNGAVGCIGWQQFIFSNGQCGGGAQVPCVFIQYWLIGFGSMNCPAGWTFFPNGTDDECYQNSAILLPPIQSLASLGNAAVIAEAASGGLDAVIFSSGTALYAVQPSDSVANLAQGWTQFEYNLVGDCCGSAATFNSGAAIVVRLSAASGTVAAPSCTTSFSGYTAETNNLSFASAPAAIRGTIPALMFTENSSGAASPCGAAVAVASGMLSDSHDFNADGRSDILWRDTGGDATIWRMSGGTILGGSSQGNVTTNWSVVGSRDFNGDGFADILWRDTAGDVWMWLMDNAAPLQKSVIGNVSTIWSVVGTGDFNGDGRGDILWRDTSGNLKIWFMNGFAVSEVAFPNVPTVWSVAAVGDFNGDGKSDILWHDSGGDVTIWEISGGTILGGFSLGNVATNWSIVGTGDFNGDHYSDILWRDTAGDVMIWLISNSTKSSQSVLGNMPTTWSIAGTGDFNGDGKSDIMWIDTSGNVQIWFMNGYAASAVSFGSVGTVWSIQGANAD